MTDLPDAAARASAIRYALDCIDTEVKLASSLETIQNVTMNTSFIRHDLAALDAARIAAEQRTDAIRAKLLSDGPMQAATNAVGRMERIDGPDPNGYVRFTAHDYAMAAITAALDAAGYAAPGDLDAEPAPARAEGGA